MLSRIQPLEASQKRGLAAENAALNRNCTVVPCEFLPYKIVITWSRQCRKVSSEFQWCSQSKIFLGAKNLWDQND